MDFKETLPGSPALSPAPWRHEWPALSSTSRGAECTDSPGGEQMGPELSDSRGEEAGGSSVRGRAGVGETGRLTIESFLGRPKSPRPVPTPPTASPAPVPGPCTEPGRDARGKAPTDI
ncbi:hypothetical protein INR49_030278 [Caranx melampygus]|nr:hypothetical protein INR49_030278 [Caranx melampygus]